MSDFIKEIDPTELADNIRRRDTVLDILKKCSKELKNNKKELGRMSNDPCHTAALYFLKARNDYIIANIEEMIKFMENGDWCLSAESTKDIEKEMNDKK